jgi:large subunit ribosomal protein L10
MANAKILEAKQGVIDEITEVAKTSASFILFDYRGLTAEEVTELRRNLRENGAKYKVWKNTLTKRAMDGLNFNLDDCLNGPSAMAYSDDSVAPIKVLSDFAKEHKALEIKGGIVDGEVTTLENIKALSTLPSREGLLTMLASGLIGTVKDLSIALNMLSEEKEKSE